MLWDVVTGTKKQTVNHGIRDWHPIFSPDMRFVAVVQETTSEVVLWDMVTAKVVRTIEGKTVANALLAFSGDGKLLADCDGSRIRVRDVATGAVVQTLDAHFDRVEMAFSPDGRSLAATTHEGIVVWELWTGAERTRRAMNREILALRLSLAFAPDSRLIAFARWQFKANLEATVMVWDLATGKDVGSLRGQGDDVYALAFAPDGSRLATARGDSTVLVWDLGRR